MTELVLHFDGAAEPNPGFATWGWVLSGLPGHGNITQFGALNQPESNNVAEYAALGMGLRFLSEYVHEIGDSGRLLVRGDSQLVLRQVSGEWKCKKARLGRLRDRVRHLADYIRRHGFEIAWEWIPREMNTLADALSKMAKRKQGPRPVQPISWRQKVKQV